MSTRMQKNDVLSECIADKKFYGDMVDDAWYINMHKYCIYYVNICEGGIGQNNL